MAINKYTRPRDRISILIVTGIILLFAASAEVRAQIEDPPRPPSITLVSDLGFGAFYSSSGGTVTIDEYDVRTSLDVTLFFFGYTSAAHFYVYANSGTIINILNIPDFQLSWSGYSMNVEIGAINPALPFVNTNPYSMPTEVTIGATLSVGNPTANPPGNYIGTFDVTLVVE